MTDENDNKKNPPDFTDIDKEKDFKEGIPSNCLRCAQDIEPKEYSWLWENRIPYGEVTALDGEPDLGKTCIFLDFAARITTGRTWPITRERHDPASVLLMMVEDSAEKTIKPRFIAAGGDDSKLFLLDKVPGEEGLRVPLLPTDVPIIKNIIISKGIKMVCIDPFMAFIDKRYSANSDQDIRTVLQPLIEAAQETGCIVIILRHWSKKTGQGAVNRASGSVGISASARSQLTISRHPHDPDERRILSIGKANHARRTVKNQSIGYRIIESTEYPGQPIVDWDYQWTNLTAEQIVTKLDTIKRTAGEKDGSYALEDAKQWLLKIIKDGPRRSSELIEEAKEDGISERTLKRAKKALNIAAFKDGESGQWCWVKQSKNTLF